MILLSACLGDGGANRLAAPRGGIHHVVFDAKIGGE